MNFANTKTIELMENEVVYFDSSSLLSKGFLPLMEKNARQLMNSGNCITVHVSVRRELERLWEEQGEENVRLCLEYLRVLSKAEVIRLVGNPLEPGSQFQQYLELIIKTCGVRRLNIVTNNDDFISDIFMENKLISFAGNTVSVYSLNDDGMLELKRSEITLDPEEDTNAPETDPYIRFLVESTVENQKDEALPDIMKKLFDI